jgi:hypothetical protein
MRKWIVLLTLLTACGGSDRASPTAPPSPTSSPDVPAVAGEAFRVAVLLSTASVPTDADVQRTLARASDILSEKTGARMSQTDLVVVGPGSTGSQAQSYINAHAASPPDGVLAFSDDANATSFGGYSLTVALPAPNVNRFPSPVVGESRAYLAVVDFFHKYARCGYDNAGNRIGSTSAGGECRNRSGLMCVFNGRYWACPDSLGDLYADPDYYNACTVVHEFTHPFGSEGNFDHYGTAQCTSRTFMSQAEAQDLRLFQQSCGMCPDVYRQFRHR